MLTALASLQTASLHSVKPQPAQVHDKRKNDDEQRQAIPRPELLLVARSMTALCWGGRGPAKPQALKEGAEFKAAESISAMTHWVCGGAHMREENSLCCRHSCAR